jgi:hypothetical protein
MEKKKLTVDELFDFKDKYGSYGEVDTWPGSMYDRFKKYMEERSELHRDFRRLQLLRKWEP